MEPRNQDAHELSTIRRVLADLEAGRALDEPSRRAAIDALARLERSGKTQRLDFASFFEMASRINSQGLDLERVEAYVTSLLRGRTGAQSVSLLRPGPEEALLVASRAPESRLDTAGPIARRLVELARPIDLAADAGELGPDGAALFADAALVAPLLQKDGDERSLRGILVLGKKVTGRPYEPRDLEFLSLISELVAIALHNAHLHFTATHDALTGLWSRGYFDLELNRELSRARRRGAGGAFSLLLLDLDHFKKVNDGFGHRAGDRVLRGVAAALRRKIRDYDTLARWGGEEFAIVLPDVNKKGALEAAERYRHAIREEPMGEENGRALPRVTASFGVASYPDDGTDGRELLQKADDALYRAKTEGRDRVFAAS